MVTYVFPGQGSQYKGMGRALFDEFPQITIKADEILGYSIKQLCLEDTNRRLGQTQYTQPALYTVNALHYLKKYKETGRKPDYVAGHSLGEYNALLVAGTFDFETGLKLVKKRGELMSQVSGGGMAAVLGLKEEEVKEILRENGLDTIDIANYNSPTQIVLSGSRDDIEQSVDKFEAYGASYIPLNVSGAFHSRYMSVVKQKFKEYLEQFILMEPSIQVISNVHARPYKHGELQQNLVDQITHPVKWTDSIRYLLGIEEIEYQEIGPGDVLTKLIQKILDQAEPLEVTNHRKNDSLKTEANKLSNLKIGLEKLSSQETENSIRELQEDKHQGKESRVSPDNLKAPELDSSFKVIATSLGNEEFKKDYNLRYAYLTGGMYKGIASKELVSAMGKAGMMGFFGTGGLKLHQIEAAIQHIQSELTDGQAYGMNLVHNPYNLEAEEQMVDLFIRSGIKNLEAAAYMSISPALIKYRVCGLERNSDGTISGNNRIIGKVSRPEVAEAFLSPAPERIVEKMVKENKLTQDQANLLKEIPMADDLCVEADSGGHTDAGVAYALVPTIIRLRDKMMHKYGYRKKVRVGAAGGIGSPEAAAAAFILGADFIVTGSINQCTVEAGSSNAVKDLLQQINVQDTEYAPAGDMFELGAKVQVLKKGVFFPARANKLYEWYRMYNSLDEIDENTRKMIQEKWFKCSFDEAFEQVKEYCSPLEVKKAQDNPKKRMALTFQWYFGYCTHLALEGTPKSEVNYQVHCGPALGAFNQWVKGTPLESWRNRHVAEIGKMLMTETAELLCQRFKSMSSLISTPSF